MKKADTNKDMSLDEKECKAIKDEGDKKHCLEAVKHCGHDGKMHVCEFHFCVMKHSFEEDCMPFCPCDDKNDSDYCNSLKMCDKMA